eukprot:GFKZ01007536.1.p1 GENE.GFKZ01007536.1~~GFKZ01007536.1.p1  ORF type:complete len:295 (-),score=38.79 GFKZ01007536.1:623-1507(-)
MADAEDTPLLPQSDEMASDTPDLPKWRKIRLYAYENVEGTIDSPLEYIILLLIFSNVVLLAASTLVVDNACFGSKCLRYGDKYDSFFEIAEAVSVYIFTFEYILRIWACVESPAVAAKGCLMGRLSYAFSFFPVVDFLSIAPYWGAMLFGHESPDFTTALRLFRLVRLLKADKYLQAFSLLGNVLAENATLLIASSFYAVLVWVVSATALYFVEADNPALGTHFQSIPQALFPVLLMLTGEFPLADFSAPGQVIAGVVAVFAVAIFAIPSALLASSFVKAMQDSTGRDFTVDVG